MIDPGAIIVVCVSMKKGGVWPASDLYRSPLWDRRRDYAVTSGLPLGILSAKYGLIHPSREIETYDVTMSEMRRDDGLSVESSSSRADLASLR